MKTAGPAPVPGPVSGRLARLADLAYRRRGRVVLAWIAVLAATVAVAPGLARGFSAEFATAGSESQAAADLVAQRFPGTSGDAIDVVWQADTGAREPAALARVERFLAVAEGLEGVAEAQPPRVSRGDGTIALARLELDRPGLDVPDETGARLIELADAAALMQLFGLANWWTPAWLDQLAPGLDRGPARDVPQEKRS